MTIVFVIDIYDIKKNGTTMTARRFAEELRKRGHTVRVVSTGGAEADKFIVNERIIPIVQHFAKLQSFVFAKPDEAVLRAAIAGADEVHLFLPLALEKKALAIARELGVPCSAAFHLQPENITYNIRLGKVKFLSDFIYRLFLKTFYREFAHIHCPSEFIASELRAHGYKAKLHVISNGITGEFFPVPKDTPKNEFHILMIGRLSPEKRQELLIRAAELSRYRDRIHLHFAGTGPRQKKLIRMGKRLPHSPTFSFYQKERLLALIHSCQLYVHTADAEIEAIACLEAIACGLVPVISDSKRSATSQFALDGRSVFRAGDAKDLAKKIDYWIEHDEERVAMSESYAQSAARYRIEQCVERAEVMFHETIEDEKKAISFYNNNK